MCGRVVGEMKVLERLKGGRKSESANCDRPSTDAQDEQCYRKQRKEEHKETETHSCAERLSRSLISQTSSPSV